MPDFVLDHEPAGFARIKVVGVGGGGCNAVDSMFDIGLQNVEFYVINSDLQALKRSKCPNRIQVGAKLTQGRGCGASPALGENCMMDAKEEIVETLRGADIVFVTAGLGGGTGTGGAPVVAKIAKEMGILTVAVVTKPFKFEGARRMKSAESGLEKLRESCDTLICINNERLLEQVGPKVPMKESFKIADNILASAVSSISDLVATPGLINVDFNDIRTIMGGKGGAVMGVGVGKGENRAAEAVKKACSSPLLDKIVIDGATGVLICITGGPDMTLSEVQDATQMVHAAADPDAEIIFGAVVDETLTDTLRVTIIATGFPEDVQRRLALSSGEMTAPALPAPGRAMHQFGRPVGANGHTNGNGHSTAVQAVAPVAAPAPAPAPVAQAPAAPAPAPVLREAAPAPAAEFLSVLDEPAPAAPVASAPLSGRPAPVHKPDSLRATLERMMAEQGHASSAPAPQAPIRVAKSNPAPAAPASLPPGVRSAASKPEAKPAVDEPAPQVNLFDPNEEQEKSAEFDSPAYVRRRRTLFE